ncbi:hypothetical protein FD754_010552 [Muntiacus muntjak]|uniref:MAPK regulated corepressor interacting protein 2 n=1 Tax=Muntiacus muntjak TaxID=9888 RepID=A0A5N3X1V3_MUNMU|nr:hypothetical protein FD754_010552 [Muntiacus muntjak]
MYTVTKGPGKLVAQRRTGPTQQQVESRLSELLKCRHSAPIPQRPRAQPPGPWPLSSPGPRLVFNRVNGRRPPATSPSFEGTQEPYTLAHEENQLVVARPVRAGQGLCSNFVPIDLDEWWAQQFLARITNCS